MPKNLEVTKRNPNFAETKKIINYESKNVNTEPSPVHTVIITGGKTTLIGETVELNGETTINLGASLEIKNQ